MKFTVNIDMDLDTIKYAYRNYFGEKGKVTKRDLADWIGSLAQADIESSLPDDRTLTD